MKQNRIFKRKQKIGVSTYLEITKILSFDSNFMSAFWQEGKKGIFSWWDILLELKEIWISSSPTFWLGWSQAIEIMFP